MRRGEQPGQQPVAVPALVGAAGAHPQLAETGGPRLGDHGRHVDVAVLPGGQPHALPADGREVARAVSRHPHGRRHVGRLHRRFRRHERRTGRDRWRRAGLGVGGLRGQRVERLGGDGGTLRHRLRGPVGVPALRGPRAGRGGRGRGRGRGGHRYDGPVARGGPRGPATARDGGGDTARDDGGGEGGDQAGSRHLPTSVRSDPASRASFRQIPARCRRGAAAGT